MSFRLDLELSQRHLHHKRRSRYGPTILIGSILLLDDCLNHHHIYQIV